METIFFSLTSLVKTPSLIRLHRKLHRGSKIRRNETEVKRQTILDVGNQ